MKKSLNVVALAVSLLITGSALAQPPSTPVVDARQANQKARINEGVKSGELNRRETARLRAEQRSIRSQEKMAKADGVVTARERAQLRREQNQASRHIAKQKHDAQKRQ